MCIRDRLEGFASWRKVAESSTQLISKRSHVASFWKVSVGFLAFNDFLAFEDLCLEQELSAKVVQFVIIWEKSRKFVPFLFSKLASVTYMKRNPYACTTSHIVKMTSLKLLLILTDNYNTYLKNKSLPNMCWLVLDL